MAARTGGSSLGRRGILAIALAALAGLLLAAAGALLYVRWEIADEQVFAARTVSALDEPAVREVVADRTVAALESHASADLLAVRPLVTSVVEGLAATRPFRRAATLGLADTHRALVAGDGSVIVRVAGTARQAISALRGVSPAIASRTSGDVRPVLTRIDRDNAALSIVRRAVDASAWAWWAAGGALLAAVASLLVATDRRRAIGHLGAAGAGAGALVAGLVELGGVVATDAISRWRDIHADRDREALDAVWQALFADLRTAGLIVAAAGLAVAALTSGVLRPGGAVERANALVRRTTIPTWVRGVGLAAAGAVCLLLPGVALRVLILGLGAALLFLGLRDIAGRMAARPVVAGEARRDGLLAGAAVTVVALGGAAATAVALAAPALPPALPPPPADGCNGSRALCERRVDQVAWPTTHNSYAAADEPGWLMPNQARGIARQLADGIRGLTLDVHWGVRAPGGGVVRTDLRAEGMTRNKVAEQIGPAALAAADRVGGRVGTSHLPGARGLYLCHTLCEIGSEPLDAELEVIRSFLDRHPNEVVTIVFEPYVPPSRIADAMGRTGLLEHAAALDRSQPLPTLRMLIDRGTRLLVFAEVDGGAYPWYMPAFSFIQDTPLGARRPSQLRCTRWRGDADSPILLLNHWIDRFPPRVSDNVRIGTRRFLERRIRRCTAVRGLAPGLVAVDFYDRTSLLDVVGRMNR